MSGNNEGGKKVMSRSQSKVRVKIWWIVGILVLTNMGICLVSYAKYVKRYKTVILKEPDYSIFGFEQVSYTLGPDDIVEIQVQGHPEFSGKFVVSPEGKIQYQYIGDVDVDGLTKEEVKEKIMGLLSEYIHQPQVMVKIVEFRSKYVYVMGEVRSPGKYPMKGSGLTVRDAVIMAGLVTPSAGMRGARLIRPTEDGVVYVRKIDLCKILYEGMLDENYVLQPGDIIYVPTLAVTKISRVLDQIVSPFYKAAVVKDLADSGD